MRPRTLSSKFFPVYQLTFLPFHAVYSIIDIRKDIRAQRGQDCYRILVLKEYSVHALILKAKLRAARAGHCAVRADAARVMKLQSSRCGRRWKLRVLSSARTSWKLTQSVDVMR
jgi:hypothetical protein